AINVSAADHIKQYPAGVLHSDGGKLFCMSYKVTVNQYRESAVDRHLDSSIQRKRKVEIQTSTATALLAKKQKTVTSIFQKSTENREARNTSHCDPTEAFVCANIPLEKLDNQKLRKFFRLECSK
ncbi:UNVERIFIED_CONTAM: hypothetical protein FKN15_059558, partial [Acipenser sinensis]